MSHFNKADSHLTAIRADECPLSGVKLTSGGHALECALGAGQVEASELTVGAGLSKDESHGPTTFPQHRVQTAGRTGVHCRRDPLWAFQAA